MKLLGYISALASIAAGPAGASADHTAEVAAYARIMADLRTAAEVCARR